MRVFFYYIPVGRGQHGVDKQYGQQSRCEMRQDLSEVGTVMLG